MFILLLLGEVFHKCQSDPFGWWCCEFFQILVDILSSLINCWERGTKFSNCNCRFVYFPFSFISFCSIYFGTPLFGAYIFRIAISSWENDSFIIILWASLSSQCYCPRMAFFTWAWDLLGVMIFVWILNILGIMFWDSGSY